MEFLCAMRSLIQQNNLKLDTHTKFLSKHNLDELEPDGRILKWTVKISDMTVLIGFAWLRTGSYEHCKQPSDYVNDRGKFLVWATISFSSRTVLQELKLRVRSSLWPCHAVSHWLPTAAAKIRAQVMSCGICGGQSGSRAGFLRVLRFPLPILISPTASH
jgi:hypothetical protein